MSPDSSTSLLQDCGPLFARLLFLDDIEPRPAALQMEVDRALLEAAELPILRFYRWEAPCMTIGYFQDMAAAQAAHPKLEIVRRWTGGGNVFHGNDAPYSLIVPRTEPFAAQRPADSYCLIHKRLAAVLSEIDSEIACIAESAPKQSAECFENPVANDLMQGSRKIAGAGQRRTRHGLLHQGSVQLGSSDFPQAWRFAEKLAEGVERMTMPAQVMERACL
ncbi:MAG: lipoate--protein ligase family protein [Verrucomicrobiota bacterium]